MRAGLLRKRVTLSHHTGAWSSTHGDVVLSATAYASAIPASIEPVSGLERWRAERVHPEATHLITIRYRADVVLSDILAYAPATIGSDAGTLTTRTDDDTGIVTLSAGHGLVNGTYDLLWTGGARRAMAGTVATNDLTLDGGTGDALPADESAVVVWTATRTFHIKAIRNPEERGIMLLLDCTEEPT